MRPGIEMIHQACMHVLYSRLPEVRQMMQVYQSMHATISKRNFNALWGTERILTLELLDRKQVFIRGSRLEEQVDRSAAKILRDRA